MPRIGRYSRQDNGYSSCDKHTHITYAGFLNTQVPSIRKKIWQQTSTVQVQRSRRGRLRVVITTHSAADKLIPKRAKAHTGTTGKCANERGNPSVDRVSSAASRLTAYATVCITNVGLPCRSHTHTSTTHGPTGRRAGWWLAVYEWQPTRWSPLQISLGRRPIFL